MIIRNSSPSPKSAPAVGGFSMTYIVIIGVSMLASFLISSTLKRRFTEYSQIPIRMTGAQVAEAMLRQNGITDVQVISTPGQLTDHYDPIKKTVNLSEPVYRMNSVAAAAVAAHECGHAVQHQQAYVWLGLRSKMVPAVQFSSKMLNYLMIARLPRHRPDAQPDHALGLGRPVRGHHLVLLRHACRSSSTPAAGPSSGWKAAASPPASSMNSAKNALFWAAMTYVAAAIGSLAQLLYFLMMALNRRE